MEISLENRAKQYLEDVYGEGAKFREGQLEAITAVLKGNRALVVQRTGWGKSLIYFLSTRMLRDSGAGLTIVISPLLALMNNQLESTEKFNLKARTINSNNRDDWDEITKEILHNEVDILFISPERLANEDFNLQVLSKINESIGMLVIDEAHCISDWGHDFRPDYRRIVNIIKFLPSNVPLLATTATANDRVVEDIVNNLGENLQVQRGELVRSSLALQVTKLNKKEERLAWLSENLPKLDGTGIIYCLTKDDCELVNDWLKKNGVDSHAYYAGIDPKERETLEKMFRDNELKVLVATTAFGMGIDKSDISFVIHFQKPGNVVAYYQQIGRAGRGIENAHAVLLAGSEDDEITSYFIESAFPTFDEITKVFNVLDNNDELSIYEIMRELDMRKGRIENALKYLSLNGNISKEKSKYYRTLNEWNPDMAHSAKISKQRYDELKRMNDFVETDECYMQFVAKELSDDDASPCGKCSNCLGKDIIDSSPEQNEIIKATEFAKKDHFYFESRKKWPVGVKIDESNKIDEERRCEDGLALSTQGDAGWGRLINEGKFETGEFSDELVKASVKMIKEHLKDNNILWVTSIPSHSNPPLVYNFAMKVAKELGLPYREGIIRSRNSKNQASLHNAYMKCENACESFGINDIEEGNVLLIDDLVDSKWTFTACGYFLRKAGSGKVYPFALSKASGFKRGD